ncbi:MAG: M1 family metallopeptidase [Myxococcota bacterium]
MPRDVHSHARPEEARVTHLGLALEVDFTHQVLRGTATLDLDVTAGAHRVVLDARRLDIRSITDEAGQPLSFALSAEDPILGSALVVELPAGCRRVVIAYATTPGADALQWLNPEQTAGGVHPFVFTQGQPIFARTWIPIQDSPGVRFTYHARITAPAPLTALMSAERVPRSADESPGVFHFRMNEPIPAYLVALVVGDIAMRELGPRTAVFAEPSVVERAAHELVDVERMVDAAEVLVGPYRWGRFDVVIMPPAFPYGGMENPRLVFASPTLIAGDRSLVTVFAHELAHAWAGNLVINATWNDFWLNEGTTVYLELRINEVLWGEDRAAMLKDWGYRELTGVVAQMGATSPDTRLHHDLTGRDPAEGVTVVPYLKGAAFFWTLERVVGRARLDAWLRGWFDRQGFRSVTTETFLHDVRQHLLGGADAGAIDLERWLFAPGLPSEAEPPRSVLLTRVDEVARAWSAGTRARSLEVTGWTPQQWRHFLALVHARVPSLAAVEDLDEAFALSSSGNAEVLAPWLRIEAMVQREAAVPRLERFLVGNGRLKYLRPIYAELLASDWGRPIAKRVYATARARYHALARGSLDRLFAAQGAAAPSVS